MSISISLFPVTDNAIIGLCCIGYVTFFENAEHIEMWMTQRECLKPCPHCCREVRLSPKTARQRRQSRNSATVALFCDSVDRALNSALVTANTINFVACFLSFHLGPLFPVGLLYQLIYTMATFSRGYFKMLLCTKMSYVNRPNSFLS